MVEPKVTKSLGKLRKPKARQPLWKGPEEDGITYSLLSRFLCCRERFRVRVVEGLRPKDQFNHRIEYGQMWHVCEEAFARHPDSIRATEQVLASLSNHTRVLCRRYPLQQEQIVHWMNVCRTQFPIYVDYWSEHPDVKNRQPLLQEQVFDVPYVLPSGRTVRLRGKWDSVDLISERRAAAAVWLQENKTKGDIDESRMQRQLQFDLQTGIYLVALEETRHTGGLGEKEAIGKPTAGVRYNVVRRPLSGGKHSIRQHQPTKSNPQGESAEAFYERLGGLIREEPRHYFMRWKVEWTPADLANFRRRCLDPILEQLCDWWKWMGSCQYDDHAFGGPHWQYPYGVYNALLEGGSTELDEYLATGSTLGLERGENLFEELSDG